MSMLTPDLQKKFEQVAILKKDLSKISQQVFDHAMCVTARHLHSITGNQRILDARFKKSYNQLAHKLKKEPSFKTFIASMTRQTDTSTASTLLKGLDTWVIAALYTEKDFKKALPPPQK